MEVHFAARTGRFSVAAQGRRRQRARDPRVIELPKPLNARVLASVSTKLGDRRLKTSP